MRNTALRLFILLAIVLTLLPTVVAAKEKKKAPEAPAKKAAPAKKTATLVWPLPPEKPRIKFLGTLSNNLDVEPPKKKGWLQKLINEEERLNVVGLKRPTGIAVDSQDRIYITDIVKKVVFVFDLANKTMELLGADGRGKLRNPWGIAIDSKDNVYVSDVGLKRVNIYDAQGNLTAVLSKVGSEVLVNPVGIALDEPRNRLLIVDSKAHKVFAASLDKLGQGTSFGKIGDADDAFHFPSNVAVDKEGRIYVADTMNFCVKIFDKNFKFLQKIGEHGTAVGMFDRPKGIALDSEENIYVVDMAFSNFQIFNKKGKALLFVGAFGQESGSFRLPSGIFIDKKDRIYISDQYNQRIQMFQFLGGEGGSETPALNAENR